MTTAGHCHGSTMKPKAENTGRHQFFPMLVLLLFSVVVSIFIFFLSRNHAPSLAPYFGVISPLIATLVLCVAAIAALYLLCERFGFSVIASGNPRPGLILAFVLALPFMISVTIADVFLRFPADTNVPLPAALLFYPAMAFIAQIALHIVPLTLLLLTSEVVCKSRPFRQRLWVSFLLVSMLEAGFQAVIPEGGSDGFLLTGFVVVQLFFFSLAEFYVFRRFDYVTMYFFRICYYGYWHILWGVLRLEWLF